MRCLFAMFSGLFSRFALFIVWIARPALVGAAFNTFLIPLLGKRTARICPDTGCL
jgi:hypothetical protein